MRAFLFVTLYDILSVTLAQIDLINQDLGDLHFHAKAGILPAKYFPLTEQDQNASDKAADVVDFIQLVPNIDPLKRELLQPVGIDLPFLWLSGEVYMKNFVMTGIKQLIVNSVELRTGNFKADLNISFPLISVEGDLNLQAYLSFLPLSMRCHISVNLMDLNVSVSSGSQTTQSPPTGEVLQVVSAAVNLDIGNILLNVTDMHIDSVHEDVGPVITQLFSDESDDNLFDGALKSVLKMINQELLMVSMDVIKSYLLSDY